jgi:hypothetical protein
LVKDLVQCERHFELRLLLHWAAVLIAMAAPATGQVKGEEKAGSSSAANNSVKYQVRATVTSYCPVARALPLHEVLFDFHNPSCQERRQVTERKTPTLPKGPFYRNVRIAGYHFLDWAAGHSSPNTRNTANVELTKTATTLSASGWLGQASCNKGSSGHIVVEDTFWQARVVPEVRFVEDVERHGPPATADIVPPKTTAVLTLSASCDGRDESLQYSVTPIVNGVAEPAIYTSPVLAANQAGVENDVTVDSLSLKSHWGPQSSTGKRTRGKSELSLTIVPSGGQSGAETKEPAHVPAP